MRTFGYSRNTKSQFFSNYQRNLLALTPVPTMALVWLTKLSFSAPKKKQLAR